MYVQLLPQVLVGGGASDGGQGPCENMTPGFDPCGDLFLSSGSFRFPENNKFTFVSFLLRK